MLCPYCDASFWMIGEMARHLAWHHGAVRHSGTNAPLEQNERGDRVRCFCGEWFGIVREQYQTMSEFARHLQDNGGPAAHMLALGFGFSEGKP